MNGTAIKMDSTTIQTYGKSEQTYFLPS